MLSLSFQLSDYLRKGLTRYDWRLVGQSNRGTAVNPTFDSSSVADQWKRFGTEMHGVINYLELWSHMISDDNGFTQVINL